MPAGSVLSVIERRGARGHMGWLLLAGHAVTTRPRSEVVARFPLYGCTLVTAGSGRYRDADHDVMLGPGDVVFVVPGHPHRYGAVSGGWEERFLAFDGPLFRLAAETGLIDVRRPVRSLGGTERWAARFDHFRLRRAPATPAERDAEAAMVLALVAEMVGSEAGAAGVSPASWLDRSRELLGAELGRPLALADVAAAVGMPYESWRRAFRTEAGVPPARFRLDRRLAAAADLVLTTSSSVREIAALLGFTDERHLTVRFLESYGCTPAAFRGRGFDRAPRARGASVSSPERAAAATSSRVAPVT
jgi:AraC-like DNA-binding protein